MIRNNVRLGALRWFALAAAVGSVLGLAFLGWSARSAARATPVSRAEAQAGPTFQSARARLEKGSVVRATHVKNEEAPTANAFSPISLLVDDIETSGDAPASWTDELKTLFSAWQRDHSLPEGTSIDGWACYANGCLGRVRFDGPDGFGQLTRSAGMEDPFKGWAERATLVGPEPSEGGSTAIWFVVPASEPRR